MRFNKLDVPYQWREEFTKYPHGYTIFEALCSWTKQVDSMVDNVNNWNDYLDKFVENFEFELQEEVKTTITKWQNEGLLDAIIESALNTELDNVKAQLADKVSQLYQTESYNPSGNMSPKAVYRVADTIFLVMSKAGTGGYVRVRIERDKFTSTESIGAPAELWRVTGVNNATDAIVLKHKAKSTHDSGLWQETTIAYNNPKGGTEKIPATRLTDKTLGAWIEYEVNIPTGVTSIPLYIYKSGSSSNNVTITIDDEEYRTGIDLTADSGIWDIMHLTVTPGTHIVRFTTNTSAYLTIGGVYMPLAEYKEGFSFDSAVVWRNNLDYIYATGATDYALFNSEINKWMGSYHGGETNKNVKYVLDGKNIDLSSEKTYVGTVFEIEQETNINNQIDTYSRRIFACDGTITTEMHFSGQALLTKLFTNMTTTSDVFDDILYPIYKRMTDEGNYYLPSGCNYIIQRNPSTNQKITTIINNKILDGREPTPYIKKTTGAYNKVYNAAIDSATPIQFNGGNFKVTHIFE